MAREAARRLSLGCVIWSCVDCRSPAGRVIRVDPNDYHRAEAQLWSGAWTEERPTLAEFLADWLQDRLPFTPDAPPPVCPTPAGFSAVVADLIAAAPRRAAGSAQRTARRVA